MNELLDRPELTKYDAKTFAAIYSLVHGLDGPSVSAERVFTIEQDDRKKKYVHLYGHCKQPFPDIKLKNFEVRM